MFKRNCTKTVSVLYLIVPYFTWNQAKQKLFKVNFSGHTVILLMMLTVLIKEPLGKSWFKVEVENVPMPMYSVECLNRVST